MKNRDIISHLKNDIKISIIKDVKNTLLHHENEKSGFHSIPRQIFCYIDYLGSIVYGKNNTRNAVEYMNSYFEPKDKSDYKKVSSVLVEMWRHGTVHEYDPKVLTNGNVQLGWLTNISNEEHNTRGHLKTFKSKDDDKKLSLKININRLTDDLLSSIDKLITELTRNNEKKRIAQEHYLKMSSDQDIAKIRDIRERIRVKEQFDDILQHISGILDEKGGVIKEF
jgi:hypothetical protein